jgi:NlpC/P60 family putative phage cell wall peptidase
VTLREQIVAEARTWLGTPFHHQGRLRGVGVDCGGLILGVGKALGLMDYAAAPVYGRRPNGPEMRTLCDALLAARPCDERRGGNILLFAFDVQDQHLAILTGEGTIVHVLAQARACVEHQFDARWQRFVSAVYSYRGVD